MWGLNSVGFGGSGIVAQIKQPSIGSQVTGFLLRAGESLLPVAQQVIAQKALPKIVANQFAPAQQQQQQQQQAQFDANLQTQQQAAQQQAAQSTALRETVPFVVIGAIAIVGGGILLYIWRRGGR